MKSHIDLSNKSRPQRPQSGARTLNPREMRAFAHSARTRANQDTTPENVAGAVQYDCLLQDGSKKSREMGMAASLMILINENPIEVYGVYRILQTLETTTKSMNRPLIHTNEIGSNEVWARETSILLEGINSGTISLGGIDKSGSTIPAMRHAGGEITVVHHEVDAGGSEFNSLLISPLSRAESDEADAYEIIFKSIKHLTDGRTRMDNAMIVINSDGTIQVSKEGIEEYSEAVKRELGKSLFDEDIAGHVRRTLEDYARMRFSEIMQPFIKHGQQLKS